MSSANGVNIQGAEFDSVEAIIEAILEVLGSEADESTKTVALNVLGTLSTKLAPSNIMVKDNIIHGMSLSGQQPLAQGQPEPADENLDDDELLDDDYL